MFGSLIKEEKIKIYIITSKEYIKTKNIQKNQHISFLIPFPHYFLRFVPSFTIYFQGIANIFCDINQDLINSHKHKRILRMSLKELKKEKNLDKLIFLEITPHKRLHCYGVGFSFRETIKNPHGLQYSVTIPN